MNDYQQTELLSFQHIIKKEDKLKCFMAIKFIGKLHDFLQMRDCYSHLLRATARLVPSEIVSTSAKTKNKKFLFLPSLD